MTAIKEKEICCGITHFYSALYVCFWAGKKQSGKTPLPMTFLETTKITPVFPRSPSPGNGQAIVLPIGDSDPYPHRNENFEGIRAQCIHICSRFVH